MYLFVLSTKLEQLPRSGTAMAGTIAFRLGLRQRVWLEPDPPAFVENLVDLAGGFGVFKIMDDHVIIVPQIALPAPRMC